MGAGAWSTQLSLCRGVTGAEPPTKPPTAKVYADWGLPWFDYYAELPAVDGGGALGKTLRSVGELGKQQGDLPVFEDPPVLPITVHDVGPAWLFWLSADLGLLISSYDWRHEPFIA